LSKKSKTKSKERRRKDKAARKAAQRAKYEGFMKAGKNTKSKRAVQSARKRRGITCISHPDGKCGNPGCTKCFGVHFRPFLSKGKPKGMPHWMWMRWDKLTKEERKKLAA
jgi:hypothetical protein